MYIDSSTLRCKRQGLQKPKVETLLVSETSKMSISLKFAFSRINFRCFRLRPYKFIFPLNRKFYDRGFLCMFLQVSPWQVSSVWTWARFVNSYHLTYLLNAIHIRRLPFVVELLLLGRCYCAWWSSFEEWCFMALFFRVVTSHVWHDKVEFCPFWSNTLSVEDSAVFSLMENPSHTWLCPTLPPKIPEQRAILRIIPRQTNHF